MPVKTYAMDDDVLELLEKARSKSIDPESSSFYVNIIIKSFLQENPEFTLSKMRSSFMSVFHRLCHERLGISLNDFYHKHNIIEANFMQFAKRCSEGRGMYGMGHSDTSNRWKDTQEGKDFLYKTRTAEWNNIVMEELGFDMEHWKFVKGAPSSE